MLARISERASGRAGARALRFVVVCARAATELQKLLLLLPYRLETFVERGATDIARPVCTLVHRVIRRCDSDDITRAAAMLAKYRLRDAKLRERFTSDAVKRVIAAQ